jgi:GNAT superfamily N-acetyltransferase
METSEATTPVVRRAVDAERGLIRALLSVAYAPYQAVVPPEAWDRYLADLLDLDRHARDGELLVAAVDGAIAGYGAFYPDATAQGLGWPAGWASGRGLAVDPRIRGRGVAAALMTEFESRARNVGAPVFAFHTGSFMTTARALYERRDYCPAPGFDRDMNAHYGVNARRSWTALAYRKLVAAGSSPAAAA